MPYLPGNTEQVKTKNVSHNEAGDSTKDEGPCMQCSLQEAEE